MLYDTVVDGIEYHRSRIQKKKTSTQKQFGFKVPKSQPLIIRSLKFLFYKTKGIVKKMFRPVYRNSIMFRRFLGEKRVIRKFEKEIVSHALKVKPDIIHAHTPFRVGLPALRAARKLGIPFIYEVRGMWEDSAVAQGRWTTKSIPYRYYRRQENKVIKQADDVIVIGTNLGKEISSRGLRQTIPKTIPNAVGRNMTSHPLDTDSAEPDSVKLLKDRLKLKDSTTVVGYIGSLRALEGVDFTAEAVAQCEKDGHDIRFLVCSSKANQEHLRNHCADLGIANISFIESCKPFSAIRAGPTPA